MHRVTAAFAGLALLALAGAVLLSPPQAAPQRAGPAAANGATAPPAIPVAPPRGATQSLKQVTPFQRIGSPYLTTNARTYDAAMTPKEIDAYYAPRLQALGYKADGTGQSCGPGRPCASDFGFRRGPNAEVVLTIDPLGAHESRYSIEIQVIVPPPRLAQSVVPADVQSLEIKVQPQSGEGYTTTEITSSAEIAHLRDLVNRLPVDTRGGHGCAMDTGERSALIFTAGGRTYTFTENPACTSVGGPGVALEDLGALWNATVQAAGLPNLQRN